MKPVYPTLSSSLVPFAVLTDIFNPSFHFLPSTPIEGSKYHSYILGFTEMPCLHRVLPTPHSGYISRSTYHHWTTVGPLCICIVIVPLPGMQTL